MADEKIYTNVGHATAYAYAKSKGYTGTEDQFATDQANFAANAQQVREDKESVEATVATFDNTTVPAAVQTVTAEGTRQVGIVGTAGDTQVARVQAEGTTQVGVVQTEGTTQKNAVQAKGEEVIASIPSDYTELTEDVEDLKSATEQNTDTISEMLSGIQVTGENLVSGTLTSGYYNGNGNITPSNKYSHLDVDITGCEYLFINGTQGSTSISGWSSLGHFKNSSDVRIENIPLQTKQPYVLQVPTGAVKLCINTDYKASDYPSSLPSALEVYKIETSSNSVVKTVDLAKSGTNVKILTGIIRNSGNGWGFIDDGDHGPLNMASVELTEGGSIVVNYGFTAKKILSLVATPDETFARDYIIGGSVNLDKVTFNVYRLPYMIGGEVKYVANTGVWDISLSNFTSASFDTTTKRLTLTHADLAGAASSPRNCCNVSGYNCDPRIRQVNNTQMQVIFINADGTTMDAPTTNMNFYITRFVPCLFANANNIVAASGNFWIMGVMEI